MKVTLKQAAEMAGVGRTTIYRKAKQGLLSVSTMADGSKKIDTAELFRVFPQDSADKQPTKHDETEMELLKQRVNLLEELWKAERHRADNLETALKMIEHKKAPEAESAAARYLKFEELMKAKQAENEKLK